MMITVKQHSGRQLFMLAHERNAAPCQSYSIAFSTNCHDVFTDRKLSICCLAHIVHQLVGSVVFTDKACGKRTDFALDVTSALTSFTLSSQPRPSAFLGSYNVQRAVSIKSVIVNRIVLGSETNAIWNALQASICNAH